MCVCGYVTQRRGMYVDSLSFSEDSRALPQDSDGNRSWGLRWEFITPKNESGRARERERETAQFKERNFVGVLRDWDTGRKLSTIYQNNKTINPLSDYFPALISKLCTCSLHSFTSLKLNSFNLDNFMVYLFICAVNELLWTSAAWLNKFAVNLLQTLSIADHIDCHRHDQLNFLLPLSDNYLISVWEALATCYWNSN